MAWYRFMYVLTIETAASEADQAMLQFDEFWRWGTNRRPMIDSWGETREAQEALRILEGTVIPPAGADQ